MYIEDYGLWFKLNTVYHLTAKEDLIEGRFEEFVEYYKPLIGKQIKASSKECYPNRLLVSIIYAGEECHGFKINPAIPKIELGSHNSWHYSKKLIDRLIKEGLL